MSNRCVYDASGDEEREGKGEREREMKDVEQSEANLAALKYISSWSSVV